MQLAGHFSGRIMSYKTHVHCPSIKHFLPVLFLSRRLSGLDLGRLFPFVAKLCLVTHFQSLQFFPITSSSWTMRDTWCTSIHPILLHVAWNSYA